MQIDYVSTVDGDWVALYVNADLFYQGHSIPDAKWLQLLATTSWHSAEIREWEAKQVDGQFPDDFLEVLFDSCQLKEVT